MQCTRSLPPVESVGRLSSLTQQDEAAEGDYGECEEHRVRLVVCRNVWVRWPAAVVAVSDLLVAVVLWHLLASVQADQSVRDAKCSQRGPSSQVRPGHAHFAMDSTFDMHMQATVHAYGFIP